jgi:PAS domain S-box-containing protein
MAGGDADSAEPPPKRRGAGRRSEDLEREVLELVVEQMRDSAIFALDLEGSVLTWNRGAQRIFGYPRSEIVGRNYDTFFTEADRDGGRPRLILDAARMRGAHHDESPRVRADGTTFWAEVVTTALLREDGTTRAFSNQVRDISERRRAEEQLATRAEEVARLADERARLVLQLLDAEQRERRRVSQALHDDALQNLIAAFDELTEADRGEAGHEEACRRIAPLLERSIDQLRDTALELHPLLLERKGLLVALDAIARGAAGLGGFRVSVRVDPGAASVNDRMVLSVARELLVNAAKHSKASRVSVVAEPSAGGVSLTVSDDGVGMSAGRREEALADGHIGLASVAERLTAIGGGLELSGADAGTVAIASVPADPSDDE